MLGNRRLAAESGADLSEAEAGLAMIEDEGKTAMVVVVDGKAAGSACSE